ncbi:hypothetical protein EON81_16765 [bacterium]|nr:MAG: hypothetical protein EON81_16765 [bacterium]
MSVDRRVLALLVLANVLWTPVNLAIKTATGGGFTPLGLAATRWTTLAVVLGLFLALPGFRKLSEANFPSRIDAGRAILLGLLFFGPTHALYYTALDKTSSFEGNALGTTAPIWVAVLSFIFLKERPTPLRLLAISIGFLGAYIVSVGFGLPALEAGHTQGNLLYTLGVLLESIVGVGAAILIRRSSGITILWFQVIGAALFYILALPWIGDLTKGAVGFAALASLGYLVFVAGMFNFGVWYTIVKNAPLSWMTITLLLQPPLSAVLGWVYLNERPTPNVWAGTGLILGALGIGMIRSRAAEPSSIEQLAKETVPT